MRKIIILLLLPILMGFSTPEIPKDGRYINKGASDMIYAIEISNNNSEIKFYLREDEKDFSSDFRTYGFAKIVSVKNKYFIRYITSYKKPDGRDYELVMKVDGNSVKFKTRNLLGTFYNSYVQYSDHMTFIYQP